MAMSIPIMQVITNFIFYNDLSNPVFR